MMARKNSVYVKAHQRPVTAEIEISKQGTRQREVRVSESSIF